MFHGTTCTYYNKYIVSRARKISHSLYIKSFLDVRCHLVHRMIDFNWVTPLRLTVSKLIKRVYHSFIVFGTAFNVMEKASNRRIQIYYKQIFISTWIERAKHSFFLAKTSSLRTFSEGKYSTTHPQDQNFFNFMGFFISKNMVNIGSQKD